MHRIRTAVTAALLASFIGIQATPAFADDRDRGDRWERRHRQEDRWDRRDDRHHDRWDRRDDRYRRDDRDRRDDRYGYGNDPYGTWDPARDYRYDPYYRGRRLGRNDRVYRGSDDRYYCRRDDGTTGLIVGGISGGVLGSVIAPRGSKVLGSIIGAAAGAVVGRAIDDGDVVCR